MKVKPAQRDFRKKLKNIEELSRKKPGRKIENAPLEIFSTHCVGLSWRDLTIFL